MDYVVEHGGIEYAHSSMHEHKGKALAILDGFPESEAKESLRELITYTIERKK